MVRVIVATGDKGGVGKSFFSRAMLDFYGRKNIQVHAFDTDKTNSTLFRFYNGNRCVKQLDIDDPSELDSFLELIAELAARNEREVVLVDCAARAMDSLLKWMKDVGFLELKKQCGFDVTIAFVLGPEKDCVAILKDVVEQFSDHVEYVIVKNTAKSPRFDIYDNSNTRKVLLESYSAIELELPALLQKTTFVLDQHNLGFSEALEDPNVLLADRSRLRTFQSRFDSAVSRPEGLWS